MLPAAPDSAIGLDSRTLPQLRGYTDSLDSSLEAAAGSAAAVTPLAAAPVVAGQLLPAIAVQGQQAQLQVVAVPEDDGATASALPQQRWPFAREAVAEDDASKQAAYDALWQWAANVSGMVSCDICLPTTGWDMHPDTLLHLMEAQSCIRAFAQEPGIRAGTVCRNNGSLCLRGTVATRDIQVLMTSPAVSVLCCIYIQRSIVAPVQQEGLMKKFCCRFDLPGW